jgi:hypothetical protein
MQSHIRGSPALLVTIASLVLGSLALVLALGQTHSSTQPADPRSPEAALKRYPNVFFGRVEDEDGKPLDGVEVFVQTAELVGNQITPEMISPRNETMKRFSVFTADGKFMVQYPHDHNEVTFEQFKKEGHEWVWDLAWTVQVERHDDNRAYQMPGKFLKCPYYEPDSEHPAIFVMHRVGSAKSVNKASRGGAEVDCQGKKTPNKPVPIYVPSAGPGSPKDEDEMAARLQQYIDKARDAEKPN